MKMILHEIAGHSAQRFLHGGDLHDDVGAVAVVRHHFLQAAHLSFDAAETLLIAVFERWIDCNGFMATADDAGTLGGVCVGSCFGRHSLDTPLGLVIPLPPIWCQIADFANMRESAAGLDEAGILPDLTLMEI